MGQRILVFILVGIKFTFTIFEIGTIPSEAQNIIKGQNIIGNLGTKCFAIVAAEDTVEYLNEIVDILTGQIKEYPIFVQVVAEDNSKILVRKELDVVSPVFQTSRNTRILCVKCSKHQKKPIKLTWKFIKHENLKNICPDTRKILNIAYNNYLPFFNFEDSKMKMNTLEGVFVETFLEKYGLMATWYNAELNWGVKDPNGTWNGVVGRVGYSMSDVGICIISYTWERGTFIDYSHPVGLDGAKWMSKPPQKLPPATNIIRIFDGITWLLVSISVLAIREEFHIETWNNLGNF